MQFSPISAIKRHRDKIVLAGALLAMGIMPAAAQQADCPVGSPCATAPISGKQLPPLPDKFEGKIERNAAQSTPWWAPRVVPPKGAPNVLLLSLIHISEPTRRTPISY